MEQAGTCPATQSMHNRQARTVRGGGSLPIGSHLRSSGGLPHRMLECYSGWNQCSTYAPTVLGCQTALALLWIFSARSTADWLRARRRRAGAPRPIEDGQGAFQRRLAEVLRAEGIDLPGDRVRDEEILLATGPRGSGRRGARGSHPIASRPADLPARPPHKSERFGRDSGRDSPDACARPPRCRSAVVQKARAEAASPLAKAWRKATPVQPYARKRAWR